MSYLRSVFFIFLVHALKWGYNYHTFEPTIMEIRCDYDLIRNLNAQGELNAFYFVLDVSHC